MEPKEDLESIAATLVKMPLVLTKEEYDNYLADLAARLTGDEMAQVLALVEQKKKKATP